MYSVSPPNEAAGLLRTREAQGLRISVYVHLVAAALMSILTYTVAQTRIEGTMTSLLAVTFGGLAALLLIPLRRERGLVAAGLFLGFLDALSIFVLPHIWVEAAGGAEVPLSYLTKTITLPITTAALISLHILALRPLFVISATGMCVLAHILLLARALSDPRTTFSVDWIESVLGPALNVPLYWNVIATTAIMGSLLAIGAARARAAVLEAIDRERLNQQFGRYFSPGVREKMRLAGEDFFRPGGKVQDVAVLFLDIRGFTRMSEAMGADATLAFLSDFQARMIRVLFSHGGTLDKFIGDGIFATFGTPISSPDDPQRSVECACAMLAEVHSLNQQRARQGKGPIQIGIGLHWGPAVVGNVGSEERLEYTVIGDTVNTASRVEAATKELGQDILLTEAVRARLTGNFDLRLLGTQQLRGRLEPVVLYSVHPALPGAE